MLVRRPHRDGEVEPTRRARDAETSGELAGHDGPVDDLHDPLEGLTRRRITGLLADPPADGPAREDRVAVAERPAVGRVETGDLVVQERALGSGHLGDAHQYRNGVPIGDVGHERQQFGANPVPPDRRIAVRRVDDRLDLEKSTQLVGLAPPEVEDRVVRPGSHRRQAGGPGPPQEPEQDGLGLIVSGVSGHRPRGEDRSSGLSGARLQIRAGIHRDAVEYEGDAEALGNRGGDVGLGAGCLADAVIHVVSDWLETGLSGEMEERCRVGAAGERAGNAGLRIGESTAAEQFGDEGTETVVQSSASRCLRPRGCFRAVTDFR